MVNEFCGFKHGVIGTDKMPADATLNNMKKADLIKLLHTAQHNYETLNWFYNNAVNVNMAQLKNNGWIPCSERLPEESKRVLLCTKDKQVCQGKRIIFCEHNRYDLDGLLRYCFDDEVIFWQPLPQPYKEGCE